MAVYHATPAPTLENFSKQLKNPTILEHTFSNKTSYREIEIKSTSFIEPDDFTPKLSFLMQSNIEEVNLASKTLKLLISPVYVKKNVLDLNHYIFFKDGSNWSILTNKKQVSQILHDLKYKD